MTVSTEISSNEYTGNGVTTDFDYKFRIFKANQLSVITSDADGDNVVTLRLGTDYTVTGANKSAGGKVILTKPLADKLQISITRDIPIKQETSFRNQSKFFAETHEDAFDYLTMLIQKIWGIVGLCLKRPSKLANWFDAKNYRISNLGKPKEDSDAADYGTVKEEIRAVNNNINKKEKRSLRVDDMDIVAFPRASARRNMQIGFDNNGLPTLFNPAETGVTGYIPIDSFEKGAVLKNRFEVLFWEEKKEYYRWDGLLPKNVSANSNPNTTGGIYPNGSWVLVGDNGLRGEIIKLENRVEGIGVHIYKGSNGQYVQNGDFIPNGTTGLTILINGRTENIYLSTKESGEITNLSEVGASIGSTTVYFFDSSYEIENILAWKFGGRSDSEAITLARRFSPYRSQITIPKGTWVSDLTTQQIYWGGGEVNKSDGKPNFSFIRANSGRPDGTTRELYGV
ncbi:hypothetical protein AB7080_12350, partial [Providencia rettgeri]